MHQGRSVFSQVMDYFPERDFQSIVERYEGNKWVQSFTCRTHFNVMAFAPGQYFVANLCTVVDAKQTRGSRA